VKSPPLLIRPAVEADYEALCALWAELDEHHRRARPELFRVPEGARRARDWFAATATGPESAVLVAEDAGRLVGLTVLAVQTPPEQPVRRVRPHVELENLVVARAFRRRGVARRLIQAAALWTRERGLNELELTVHEFNATARAFYEAAGFMTARRRMSLPVPSASC
jgi:ribosomal protein S18 acetylase RimI-like enzyme